MEERIEGGRGRGREMEGMVEGEGFEREGWRERG